MKETNKTLIALCRDILCEYYHLDTNTPSLKIDSQLHLLLVNESKQENISVNTLRNTIICKYLNISILVKTPKNKQKSKNVRENINIMLKHRNIIPIEKCANCGYDKEQTILHIHHIDGDNTNNNANNLIVLCANCHLVLHRSENTVTLYNIEIPKPHKKLVGSKLLDASINYPRWKFVKRLPKDKKLTQKEIEITKCYHCGFDVEQMLDIYYTKYRDINTWRVLCPNCYGSIRYEELSIKEIGLD